MKYCIRIFVKETKIDVLMGSRLKLLSFFVIVAWSGLVCRLFFIQVYNGGKFEDISKNQHLREEILQPVRGTIFDRHGAILSIDLAYYEFSAEPPQVKDQWEVASVFSANLGKPRAGYLQKLKQNKKFVYLDRKVPAQKADSILKKNLPGVFYNAEYKRFYPHGEITGPVTGFTNVDNVGIEGLEYKFNTMLSGASGKQIVTTDARGNQKKDYNYPVHNPVNGNSIITTIDLNFQTIAFEELSNTLKKHDAVSGTVILMDPNTGEVYSMVSLPSFDSNSPGDSPAHLRKNRSINDTFEPGSVFKLVTAAAAFDLGSVSMDEPIFCENGKIRIGNRILRDAKPHGYLTAKEVFEYSSNIGTYKIAAKVGNEQLYHYSRQFGFGSKTGIDLNGESSGIVRSTDQWSSHSLASISIGHEVTVTALQIVNAFAVVANGGTLMKPYIVKAVVDPSGKTIRDYEPQKVKRIISAQTAEKLKDIFAGVVDHGTGILAQISGGLIAGKTGTAQKVDPVTQSYSETEYIASFVAFYPSRNPQIVGIAILDSPHGTYYGGTVAAPLLKNIFLRIMHSPGSSIFASYTQLLEEDEISQSWWDRLKSLLVETETAFADNKSSSDNDGQNSEKNTVAARDKPIMIPVGQNMQERKSANLTIAHYPHEVQMPDVRGLSIREAVTRLTTRGFDFKINGSGLVTGQSPLPGKSVLRGTVVYILGKTDK
jgi:cell division protein FtsI (penicillin-binding protein 3)